MLLLTTERPASAAPVAYRLVYSDDAGCATPEEVSTRVSRELGSSPFLFMAPDVIDVHVEKEGGLSRPRGTEGGKIWGRYVFLDGTNRVTGEHEPFSAATCKELLDLLSFSLGTALKKRLSGETPAAPQPSGNQDVSMPSAQGVLPSPVEKVKEPAVAGPAETRTWGLRFGVDGLASVALVPNPLPGLSISAGVRWRVSPVQTISVSAEARTLYPIRQSIADAGADFSMQPFLGMLVPCWHESFLVLCVPVGAGAARIIGYKQSPDLQVAPPAMQPIATVGARVGVEIPVRRPLALRAALEGLVPLPAPRVCIGCEGGAGDLSGATAWQVPPLTAALIVGAVADFL